MKLGLGVITWKPSTIGKEKNVRVMKTYMSSFVLARQPSWHISMYKGYEINGNTFYTVAQDNRSTNQNSGVRVDATDPDGNKHIMAKYMTYGN